MYYVDLMKLLPADSFSIGLLIPNSIKVHASLRDLTLSRFTSLLGFQDIQEHGKLEIQVSEHGLVVKP
jgi:hypothetical protein